jgi:hypothetical protein
MDESRVTALMIEATDEVAGQRFDPEDDLRRGRAAQRRRSTKVTAAAVLGTAAAVVVALALAGQLAWRQDVQVAGGPEHTATTAPTRLDTAAVTSTTVSPQTTSATAPTPLTQTPLPGMPGVPAGVAEFARLLFAVAQDHVDPDHARLEWTEGFTGSSGGNVKEWGRKFGWQAPGESGQAMLYLGVGNIPAADRLGCGQYDYQGTRKCTTATLPNGQPAVEMSSPTRLEVHWSRPDGTYVFVIVDAVFGNNTTVASKAPLPTLAQLEQLVMDPRLVLPS